MHIVSETCDKNAGP